MRLALIIPKVTPEPKCDCSETAIRKDVDRNGRMMYRRQCTKCGMPVGTYLRYRDVSNRDQIQGWNQILQDKTWNARNVWFLTNQKANSEARRDDYLAYLESEAWAAKRRAVLERDGYLCQACGIARATEVHHQTYEHLFNEPMEDLISVCGGCHAKVHGRLP